MDCAWNCDHQWSFKKVGGVNLWAMPRPWRCKEDPSRQASTGIGGWFYSYMPRDKWTSVKRNRSVGVSLVWLHDRPLWLCCVINLIAFHGWIQWTASTRAMAVRAFRLIVPGIHYTQMHRTSTGYVLWCLSSWYRVGIRRLRPKTPRTRKRNAAQVGSQQVTSLCCDEYCLWFPCAFWCKSVFLWVHLYFSIKFFMKSWSSQIP